NLVTGDQPWPERTERVAALALGPLSRALDLEGALGNVVRDAVAGDVVESFSLRDIFCRAPDHHGEFHLPVGLRRTARDGQVVIGHANGRAGLHEDDRLGRYAGAGLSRVIGVVEANADELARTGNAGSETWRAIDGWKRRKLGLRKSCQRIRID